jgi:hypothetical protein
MLNKQQLDAINSVPETYRVVLLDAFGLTRIGDDGKFCDDWGDNYTFTTDNGKAYIKHEESGQEMTLGRSLAREVAQRLVEYADGEE